MRTPRHHRSPRRPSGTPHRTGYPRRIAAAGLDDDAKRDVRTEFAEAVNISAAQLRRWLDTDGSRSVGDTGGSGRESTGHEMGRHVVELRDEHVGDLDDGDCARMRKVAATSTATSPSARRVTSPTRAGGTR